MPVVAEPRAAELRGPVGYDDRWLLLAVAALALVAIYYAAVLWFTRRRGPRTRARATREQHLARLAQIEEAVAAGRIGVREGHQQVSDTVRTYAASVTALPARTMTLADLRREGPADLAELVALVYPPEFAPEEQPARERFGDALGRARELVHRW